MRPTIQGCQVQKIKKAKFGHKQFQKRPKNGQKAKKRPNDQTTLFLANSFKKGQIATLPQSLAHCVVIDQGILSVPEIAGYK